MECKGLQSKLCNSHPDRALTSDVYRVYLHFHNKVRLEIATGASRTTPTPSLSLDFTPPNCHFLIFTASSPPHLLCFFTLENPPNQCYGKQTHSYFSSHNPSLFSILSIRKLKIAMAQTTTLKKFESVFPKLVEDILDHAKQYNLPQEFVDWYKAVGALLPSGYSIADSCSP